MSAEFNTESVARQVLDTTPIRLNDFVARGVNLSPLKQALLRVLRHDGATATSQPEKLSYGDNVTLFQTLYRAL